MIVRSLRETVGTEREVRGPDWISRRLILAREKAGFSVNDTLVRAGAELKMWYANHIEAVYVLEGTGEVVDDETGQRHPLEPGVLYLLDGHEHHTLRTIPSSGRSVSSIRRSPAAKPTTRTAHSRSCRKRTHDRHRGRTAKRIRQ